MAEDSPTGGPPSGPSPSTNDESAAIQTQTSKLKRSRLGSSSEAVVATVGPEIAEDGGTSRRSIVWLHFEQLVVDGISRAKFKHCEKLYRCDTRRNVVDGINEIKYSIKKIRHAVRFVKQSPARLAKFRECCDDEGIVSKSLLCLDVSTRWNSTYLMLNVAQKFERAFERYEIKDPYFKLELKHGPPSFVDWEHARRMVDILSHFYELTLRISGTSYVTSNEFYHEISSVNCLLREWIASDDLDIKAMVFVDPRYKLEFLEYALCEEHGEKNGSEIFKSVKGSVHELFEAYKLIYQPHCATSTQSMNRVSSLNESSHLDLSKNKSRDHLGDKFKRHKIESGEVENWLRKKKSKWTKSLEESLVEDIAKIEEALQGVGISDVNDNENTMEE
ncbi:Unknown protein [Striga hermonthica]|uniref:Transposase n=1 Tax=Striga hermonthica TaxID=68872 RepID=A0A9N7MHS5_STRHE|nr:Unknown protein [Striga hermonthica]